MEYAGFWKRFGAYWIDIIILAPLIAIWYYGSEYSRLFHLYWLLPSTAIGLWFSVYLVARYGGTPGKLLLKTKIVMIDGSPVTPKAAVIRHSVLFLLSLAGSIAMGLASLNMTDSQYLSLSFSERSQALLDATPDWYGPVDLLMHVWIWSEFVVLLFNKRRRAIHDYMAGTVVVKIR